MLTAQKQGAAHFQRRKMNELIERVEEQLRNNWAVEAEDIYKLVLMCRHLKSDLISERERNKADKLLFVEIEKAFDLIKRGYQISKGHSIRQSHPQSYSE